MSHSCSEVPGVRSIFISFYSISDILKLQHKRSLRSLPLLSSNLQNIKMNSISPTMQQDFLNNASAQYLDSHTSHVADPNDVVRKFIRSKKEFHLKIKGLTESQKKLEFQSAINILKRFENIEAVKVLMQGENTGLILTTMISPLFQVYPFSIKFHPSATESGSLVLYLTRIP